MHHLTRSFYVHVVGREQAFLSVKISFSDHSSPVWASLETDRDEADWYMAREFFSETSFKDTDFTTSGRRRSSPAGVSGLALPPRTDFWYACSVSVNEKSLRETLFTPPCWCRFEEEATSSITRLSLEADVELPSFNDGIVAGLLFLRKRVAGLSTLLLVGAAGLLVFRSRVEEGEELVVGIGERSRMEGEDGDRAMRALLVVAWALVIRELRSSFEFDRLRGGDSNLGGGWESEVGVDFFLRTYCIRICSP